MIMEDMVVCIPENKLLKELVCNCNVISEQKCLIDIRDLNVVLNIGLIRSLSHFSIIDNLNYRYSKLGILTDTPEQVVIATFIKKYNETKNINIGIFSTRKGVMEWLS